MKFLDPRAIKDWIKSRAVNSMMATEKGFFMDARQGPVIREELDDIQTGLNEINSKLVKLKGWEPYNNNFNAEFTDGFAYVDVPGKNVTQTAVTAFGILEPNFNGIVSAQNGKILITGYNINIPLTGVHWISLSGLIKTE